jgi:hypothetical protein
MTSFLLISDMTVWVEDEGYAMRMGSDDGGDNDEGS